MIYHSGRLYLSYGLSVDFDGPPTKTPTNPSSLDAPDNA